MHNLRVRTTNYVHCKNTTVYLYAYTRIYVRTSLTTKAETVLQQQFKQ